MKSQLSLALVLCLLGGAAHASATNASKLHLLDESSGQLNPVAHAKTDLFLLGLGLAAGGLALGGAGFAVLALCGEGSSCYSPTVTYIGWGLAAPGVLPLAAGLIIIYLFTGSRYHADLTPATSTRWALTLLPTQGGGMLGAVGTF